MADPDKEFHARKVDCDIGGACAGAAEPCCARCNTHDLAGSGVNATGALAVLNLWSCDTGVQRITGHDAASPSVLRYTATWQGLCDVYRGGDGRYYLEGSPGLLDAPEEWLFDTAAKRVLLPSPPLRCFRCLHHWHCSKVHSQPERAVHWILQHRSGGAWVSRHHRRHPSPKQHFLPLRASRARRGSAGAGLASHPPPCAPWIPGCAGAAPPSSGSRHIMSLMFWLVWCLGNLPPHARSCAV